MLMTMFVVICDVVALLAALIWIAGVAHTAADGGRRFEPSRVSRRRFANPAARAFWVGVAALLPVIRLGLYLLVRPAETRVERRVRRLTMLHLERLAGTESFEMEIAAARPAKGQEMAGVVAAVPLEAAV